MLKLCKHYGPLIGHIGDEPFHDFPGPRALAGKGVEAHLRELGFGYRAKYIAETARIVTEDWARYRSTFYRQCERMISGGTDNDYVL